jgi:hypothetical protein
MTDDATAAFSQELVAEAEGGDCYNATPDFPRLERAIVPQAVTDVQYTLSLRALLAFKADTAAVLRQFSGETAT